MTLAKEEHTRKLACKGVFFLDKNSIRCDSGRYDLTHNLENVVYNELIYMGYKVTVYDNLGREIDFLAEKGNYRYYIQVAYSVAEEKTYQREI